LKGLVPDRLYGQTIYNDPISSANSIAQYLKETKKCDYVICLSHLGFKYKGRKVSDVVLAKKSEHIDLIIGGHTHTFLKEVVQETNAKGQAVLINQVGWGGINMGVININFSYKSRPKISKQLPVKISKETIV